MINLTKVSNTTKRTTLTYFDTFDEMEKSLSGITTAHYNVAKYYISSDDWEALKTFFIDTYNQEYYTFDEDLQVVFIQKMRKSQKRKLNYKKTKIEPIKALKSAIKRLKNKGFDVVFDEVLYSVEIEILGSKVNIIVDPINIQIESFTIYQKDYENYNEFNDFTKLLKYVHSYLTNTTRRYKE